MLVFSFLEYNAIPASDSDHTPKIPLFLFSRGWEKKCHSISRARRNIEYEYKFFVLTLFLTLFQVFKVNSSTPQNLLNLQKLFSAYDGCHHMNFYGHLILYNIYFISFYYSARDDLLYHACDFVGFLLLLPQTTPLYPPHGQYCDYVNFSFPKKRARENVFTFE
jgi:hypothetical protein